MSELIQAVLDRKKAICAFFSDLRHQESGTCETRSLAYADYCIKPET